ncbi:sialate:O-sulfotransferase 1-like [Mytilus edulis]|uniref:sialate:O-sulfotransferase 1-like n=2 Tax=Mytilus TaxID=6548 RepID=UPI0039EF3602
MGYKRVMHRLIELMFLVFQLEQVDLQCSYSALGHAEYVGCFIDSDPIRKFPYLYGGTNILTLTIDLCILGCADDGFRYAGVQSRQWCHCGNDPHSDLAIHPNVSDSECNTPCLGNWTQMCGADWRLSIYRIREVISVPTFQQYGTAFYGSAISSQPLKSEVIHRNGLKAKVDCANACGEIIDCKVFSISSQTKLCHMFEHTTQLCDANIMEPNTSVHLLL